MRKIVLLRIAFAIAVLSVWEFASGRWIGAMYISTPSAIAKKLYLMIGDGTLFFHMGFTAFEAGLGFLCGGTAGFVVGLILGRARTASEVLDPFIMGFYSLPKIAMAPLFVMWFGIGIGMTVVFVSMVCFLLVFLNTYSGVRSVSRELVTIFKLMGAGETSVTQLVVVPSALTWVLAGLKLPSVCAGCAIIGELVAGNRGSAIWWKTRLPVDTALRRRDLS